MNNGQPAVLIVEDDDSTAELERRALRRAGRHVQTVRGVADALQALRDERILAVLLDYRLPDGEPWAVLEAARQSVPRIPVILVTAMGDERVAAEVFHRGGADYLIKTDGFCEQLETAVDRVLRLTETEQINERLAAIVESSDDAIFSKTLEGLILSWNPGAEKLFGYGFDEVIGKSGDMLLPSDRLAEEKKVYERVRLGETTRQLATKRNRKNGSVVDVSITVCPIFDAAGTVIGAATVCRDVTEQRKLEEQLRQSQKMEAVGQLAGGIAHDFNNILTIINGYTDLLLGHGTDQPGYDDLAEIRRAGERAAVLTRQLLAFSRKQKIDPKVLNLNGIVLEMEKMLRRILGEDIDLVTKLSPTLGQCRVDAGQVEQIVMNLAVNARDAMPSGGALIIETSDVELHQSMEEGQEVREGPYVLLAVSDTGTGMDAGTLSHIFEPFFTTKQPGHGTGLGLATVFGIVSQSGGHVRVYSEPGTGSTFRIYFPRVEAAADALGTARSSQAARGGSETVLLVEDDGQVRKITRQILERSGYRVLEGTGAADGIDIARRHGGDIHLLLSDVVMPDVGGPALAQDIVALRPAIKVLFLSGYTDLMVGKTGTLRPGAPFLEKPFTPNRLLSKVREVLDARVN